MASERERQRFPRVFVEWASGAWLNSDGPDFQEDLLAFVAQYGAPTLVEYREFYEGRSLCDACLASDSDDACPDCAG